jgi:hypothetical protein
MIPEERPVPRSAGIVLLSCISPSSLNPSRFLLVAMVRAVNIVTSAVPKKGDSPQSSRDLATYQAKLLAAAYVYPHVGNNALLAWETVEDLANKDEHYRRLRQWADAHVPIALKWSDGVKSITDQDRLDRAEQYFERFLHAENIQGLTNYLWHPHLLRHVYFLRRPEHWRDQGFTVGELGYLRERFQIFWENHS